MGDGGHQCGVAREAVRSFVKSLFTDLNTGEEERSADVESSLSLVVSPQVDDFT